jgi:hypothetical protein
MRTFSGVLLDINPPERFVRMLFHYGEHFQFGIVFVFCIDVPIPGHGK